MIKKKLNWAADVVLKVRSAVRSVRIWTMTLFSAQQWILVNILLKFKLSALIQH